MVNFIKSNLLKSLLASVFIVPSSAFAWQWIDTTNISTVQATTHIVLINIESTHPNADQCTLNEAGKYVVIDMSEPSGQWLYSTAMSAFMGGKSVAFASDGCMYNPDWPASQGGGSYPKLTTIQVN